MPHHQHHCHHNYLPLSPQPVTAGTMWLIIIIIIISARFSLIVSLWTGDSLTSAQSSAVLTTANRSQSINPVKTWHHTRTSGDNCHFKSHKTLNINPPSLYPVAVRVVMFTRMWTRHTGQSQGGGGGCHWPDQIVSSGHTLCPAAFVVSNYIYKTQHFVSLMLLSSGFLWTILKHGV